MKRNSSVLKIVCAVVCVCGIMVSSVSAEDLLIRGKINVNDGTEINISAPICLLEVLKAPIPFLKEEQNNQIKMLVDGICSDIASMKGQDIVKVEGPDKVRFWVDAVDQNHPEEVNFVKVNVNPAKQDQPKVQVCIPKGVFFLASFIGNTFMQLQGNEILKHLNVPMPPMPPMHQPDMKNKEDMKEMKHQEKIEIKTDGKPDPERIKKEIMDNVMKELQKALGEKK